MGCAADDGGSRPITLIIQFESLSEEGHLRVMGAQAAEIRSTPQRSWGPSPGEVSMLMSPVLSTLRGIENECGVVLVGCVVRCFAPHAARRRRRNPLIDRWGFHMTYLLTNSHMKRFFQLFDFRPCRMLSVAVGPASRFKIINRKRVCWFSLASLFSVSAEIAYSSRARC